MLFIQRFNSAFAKWTQHIPVTIAPASSNVVRADIHIRFVPLGPSETVYAATSMVADGTTLSSGLINITFNDDYNWSDDRLFNFTAVHEIGHTLGLSHSKVQNAVMWPFYEGITRVIHPDDEAAVHAVYGWRNPRWTRIDANPGTRGIVQISSGSSIPSPLDGLYQLRMTGEVLWYSPNGNWLSVDKNKDTVQIAGSSGNLYQRHADGSIYRYTGSGSNWQWIGASSDNIIDIVAAADQIYTRRKDGWVARWSGSGTTWNSIEQPLLSKQIAVSDKKTLWNLLTTGEIVRSEWPYGSGWAIIDQNPENTAITVGGEEFYKLQGSSGQVVWLDMETPMWRMIEDAGSSAIYASGQYLYSYHNDGSIWRYTDTPFVWEQLDNTSNSASVIGDSRGNVWEMLKSGDILQLIS
ncbi:zincin [Zopfia rhizophila CBS 207.26]|uniref:Zincin n=1 Tax=Zopfia rhizophila CBS 207.26 TaxID=1314779 RepID=A0A6A6E716_9PEZI|nr:zincin [Zopfia rhizophila CBS 207.26]